MLCMTGSSDKEKLLQVKGRPVLGSSTHVACRTAIACSLSSCELGEHLQKAEEQQQEAEKQQECSRCQGTGAKAHQDLR